MCGLVACFVNGMIMHFDCAVSDCCRDVGGLALVIWIQILMEVFPVLSLMDLACLATFMIIRDSLVLQCISC